MTLYNLDQGTSCSEFCKTTARPADGLLTHQNLLQQMFVLPTEVVSCFHMSCPNLRPFDLTMSEDFQTSQPSSAPVAATPSCNDII